MQLQTIAFRVTVVVVALYAWRRGGAPERIAAGLFLAAIIASDMARTIGPDRFRHVEWGIAAIDIALFGGLTWLALRADRMWPIWCVAWLLVAFVGHLAMGVMPTLFRPAYQVTISLSSWPTMFLLAKGVRNHQRRLRRNGVDPSWSRCSPGWRGQERPRPD